MEKENNPIWKQLLLLIPKSLGLVMLYKLLFNPRKIFEVKELFMNWIVVLLFILLLIFLVAFSIESWNVDNISFISDKYSNSAKAFGGGSFILMLLLITSVPFKIYFRKDRKRKNASKK